MRRFLPPLVLWMSISASAQGTYSDAAQNLRTCLTGTYPALCNHSLLTPTQAQEVRAAELRANLSTCMTGRYPALCNHGLLTPTQAQEVRAAELRENLSTCMTGKYPALCNHGWLTSTQVQEVRAAELRENFSTCMTGRYPALCSHSLLTPEQSKTVAAAEARLATVRPTVPSSSRSYQPQTGNCGSGLSILSVQGDGKIIKLDDGSLWEVNDVDTVDTALWLPATDVVVCNGKIINTDDNESADVTPISSGRSGSLGSSQSARSRYEIQASANDETFVINREVFSAKTYCFHFEQGDRVVFIEGSPVGACASAKLLNLRTGDVCEVWCE